MKKANALLDKRVICCGDHFAPLEKLRDAFWQDAGL